MRGAAFFILLNGILATLSFPKSHTRTGDILPDFSLTLTTLLFMLALLKKKPDKRLNMTTEHLPELLSRMKELIAKFEELRGFL